MEKLIAPSAKTWVALSAKFVLGVTLLASFIRQLVRFELMSGDEAFGLV